MIIYPIGSTDQAIVFSDRVLRHLTGHRQLQDFAREAGGQLFATFHQGVVNLETATGPRPTDSRFRLAFIPDRLAERREIKREFRYGRHYVGDWHTHPERVPKPSTRDAASFQDVFRKSHHGLASFVMVIVGTADPPEGLFVGLCGGTRITPLAPSEFRTNR